MSSAFAMTPTAATVILRSPASTGSRFGWWSGVKARVRGLVKGPPPPSVIMGRDGYPSTFFVPGLGGISVGKELGKGGVGVVREAKIVETGELVAIKFLQAEREPELLEAQAVALDALSPNPHMVKILAFGQVKGISYLIMERLNGKTLREELGIHKGNRTLPLSLAIKVGRAIVSVLKEAAKHGFAIGDISPSNIFIDENGNVTLIDPLPFPFGFKYKDGRVIGNLTYASPEQIKGRISRWSDRYSLGILLYEMFAGEHPFKDDLEHTAQIMLAQVEKPLPYDPAILARSSILEVLMPMVARLTNKRPEDRDLDLDTLDKALAYAQVRAEVEERRVSDLAA